MAESSTNSPQSSVFYCCGHFLGNESPFALLRINTHGGDDSLSGLFETRIGRAQRVECRVASSVDFDVQQDPMVASWAEQIHNNVVDVTDIGRSVGRKAEGGP
jgi:hypothetical protein